MTELGLDAAETVKRTGRWTLVAGISQVVLGLFAIMLVGATTLVTVVILGVILAATGLVDVIDFVGTARTRHSWWKLARGVLFAVAGVVAVARPETAAAAVTLLMAALLLASGIFRMAAAYVGRPPRWGWIVAAGTLSVLLGALILLRWPSSSIWLIGMFVGVEMMFHGWTMVMVWLGFRTMATNVEQAM